MARGTITTSLEAFAILATLTSALCAGVQAQERAASSHEFNTLAVVGFARGDLSDRYVWIPTAVEETLTRRLRHAPDIAVIPTARAYQARGDLREKKDDAPVDWSRTLRLCGVKKWLRGECHGDERNLSLDLELVSLAGEGETGPRGSVGPGRLMDVLDQATRWALDNLKATSLSEDSKRLIFAQPAKSPSALQYTAVALAKARGRNLKDAAYYVSEALGYDQSYRPALIMIVKLEMGAGGAALDQCAGHLRFFHDMATTAGDEFDEAEFETSQGLLLMLFGTFEPALQRFEHALELARKHDDPFGEAETLSQITEYWLSYRPTAGDQLSDEQRAQLRKDNLNHAAESQTRVLDLLERLGDALNEVQAANKLALIREQLDMPDEALAMHKRALAAAKRTQSTRNEATALSFLGRFYSSQKRWQEALDVTNQCLALAGDEAVPTVRMTLGAIYRGMKSPREALAQYDAAYKKLSQGTDLVSQLACLRALAEVQVELGDKQAAITRLSDALDIATALESSEATNIRNRIKELRDDSP